MSARKRRKSDGGGGSSARNGGNGGNGGEEGDGDECPICFESLEPAPSSGRSGRAKRHRGIFFPCGHTCCSTCYGRVEACPLCRTGKDGHSGEERRVENSQLNGQIPVFVRRFLAALHETGQSPTEVLNQLRSGASPAQRGGATRAREVRYQPGSGDSPLDFTVSIFNIRDPGPIMQAASVGMSRYGARTHRRGFLTGVNEISIVPEFDQPVREHVSGATGEASDASQPP